MSSYLSACVNLICRRIHFSWNNLVRKNYEIEKACLELEMELNQMKVQ